MHISIATKNVLVGALSVLGLFCMSSTAQAEDLNEDHSDQHFVGAFMGVIDNHEADLVSGVEYEFKFQPHFGIGALVEHASQGEGVSSAIAAAYYHPVGGLRFGAGYGRELIGGDHSHSVNLLRVGVSYEFHLPNHVGAEPSINVDRVDGENAMVYGVAIVMGL